ATASGATKVQRQTNSWPTRRRRFEPQSQSALRPCPPACEVYTDIVVEDANWCRVSRHNLDLDDCRKIIQRVDFARTAENVQGIDVRRQRQRIHCEIDAILAGLRKAGTEAVLKIGFVGQHSASFEI